MLWHHIFHLITHFFHNICCYTFEFSRWRWFTFSFTYDHRSMHGILLLSYVSIIIIAAKTIIPSDSWSTITKSFFSVRFHPEKLLAFWTTHYSFHIFLFNRRKCFSTNTILAFCKILFELRFHLLYIYLLIKWSIIIMKNLFLFLHSRIIIYH